MSTLTPRPPHKRAVCSIYLILYVSLYCCRRFVGAVSTFREYHILGLAFGSTSNEKAEGGALDRCCDRSGAEEGGRDDTGDGDVSAKKDRRRGKTRDACYPSQCHGSQIHK